ncbi:hypothetical protein IAG15_17050, partial [Enterococcus faecalis]|nr:hypothetical protein [Enterococcus faecalis]
TKWLRINVFYDVILSHLLFLRLFAQPLWQLLGNFCSTKFFRERIPRLLGGMFFFFLGQCLSDFKFSVNMV